MHFTFHPVRRCDFARARVGSIVAIACLLLGGSAWAGNQSWTGQGPRAKSIEAIVRDPMDTSRLWAATLGAGIYRSTDGGASWTGCRSGLVNTFVRCIAVNPHHPDSLYCGTNGGVYRSADGGTTWTPVLTISHTVRAIAINPRNTSVVYAATYGKGVYKTLNAGVNWNTTNFGLMSSVVRDLALRPAQPETLFAAAGVRGGVHRSFNGGLTWAQVPDTAATLYSAEQIEFDPQDPNCIYAAQLDHGIVRSLDGGTTWAHINQGLTTLRGRSLAIADSMVYFGSTGAGVFARSRHASSWQATGAEIAGFTVPGLACTAGSPSPRPHGQVLASNRPATMWAGTDGGGIFRSDDGGRRWVQRDGGLLGTFGFTVAVRPSTHAVYGGCGFGDQFWRSTNYGQTWSRDAYLSTRESAHAVVPDPISPTTVYLAVYGAGIYRSLDDGKTWTNPDSSTGTLTNRFVRRLVAWPGQSGHLFAGTGLGVWESIDGGTTWMRRGVGLPLHFSVRSLALVPGAPATLYAGSDTSGVYKSADGGMTWLRQSSGLTSLNIRDLLVDQRASQTLYAGTDAGVFRSLDGGSSWALASAGLPLSGSVRTLVQDALHPFALFCGVWGGGVFESRDSGQSWQPLYNQSGLPSLGLRSLAVDGEMRTLYAGTDAGISELSAYPLGVADVDHHPVIQKLSLAAWPNPMHSGGLRVRYSLDRASTRARVEVFDVAGLRVRTLEDRRQAIPGEHAVTWDGRDHRGRRVTAGIYFVRLQCDDGVRTTRIVATH